MSSKVDIWILRRFLLIEECPDLFSWYGHTSCSYTWNYGELATLLIPSESLTEGGFGPFFIRSYLDFKGKHLEIEQCSPLSSWCEHTLWFLRLELQRPGSAPHSKENFSWEWIWTTDYRINAEESPLSDSYTFKRSKSSFNANRKELRYHNRDI